jgi:hypothetical protein
MRKSTAETERDGCQERLTARLQFNIHFVKNVKSIAAGASGAERHQPAAPVGSPTPDTLDSVVIFL